jgi:8-oxo-dGTP pyrophosphatase MutT (NUDIX family)
LAKTFGRPHETSSFPRFAAGALIYAESTGRVLLLDRADGGGWSHPGGWAELGEDELETAGREVDEEIGGLPAGSFRSPPELSICRSGWGYAVGEARPCGHADLIYALFQVYAPGEFAPRLNDEHRGYTWAEPDDIGPHLHPGCAAALRYLRRMG